ncbi:MAG TPA: hypothetical protein VM123_21755 [archaeon]|nr:hypothetical protein [archaeon]
MEHVFSRSKVRRVLLTALLLAAVTCLSCTLEPPPKKVVVKEVKVAGGGVEIKVHSVSGLITGLIHEQTGVDLLSDSADSRQACGIGIEIYDELDRRRYSDLLDSVVVRNFEETGKGAGFEKRFANAPFFLKQRIEEDRDGVFVRCRAVAIDKDVLFRSVRFSYLVPLPRGFYLWVPNGAGSLLLDGDTSAHFVYGPGADSRTSISIPLTMLWKPGGPSVTLAVPLELEPVRVKFEIEPGRLPLGVTPSPEERDFLRITFDLVGLGADREMETGLWIYGHESDWRPALGAFAMKYRPYFESSYRAVEQEGFLRSIEPAEPGSALFGMLKQEEIKLARIDWNFYRHGEWVPPQALRFDDFTWASQIDPGKYNKISVGLVRSTLDNLLQSGISPIIYSAFNQYCRQEIAEENFAADIALDERGRRLEAFAGHYVMHAGPESPFGMRMLEQQRRMIELYPKASGFFFDDWNMTGIDFAHDDGLTVVHNRPAYCLARNLREVGGLLIGMVHKAGKAVAAAQPVSIADARGIDIFFLSDTSPEVMRKAALMCLWRPIVADNRSGTRIPGGKLEQHLKAELLWGVMPSGPELGADPALARAYRPLFLALAGREWVLTPQPLKLPEGVEGQIFMVPSSSRSRGKDILVAVVQPNVSLEDGSLKAGVVVRVRVPEIEYIVRAAWTPAVRSPWTMPLKPVVGEEEVTVELPPFGPAGILLLGRR